DLHLGAGLPKPGVEQRRLREVVLLTLEDEGRRPGAGDVGERRITPVGFGHLPRLAPALAFQHAAERGSVGQLLVVGAAAGGDRGPEAVRMADDPYRQPRAAAVAADAQAFRV